MQLCPYLGARVDPHIQPFDPLTFSSSIPHVPRSIPNTLQILAQWTKLLASLKPCAHNPGQPHSQTFPILVCFALHLDLLVLHGSGLIKFRDSEATYGTTCCPYADLCSISGWCPDFCALSRMSIVFFLMDLHDFEGLFPDLFVFT